MILAPGASGYILGYHPRWRMAVPIRRPHSPYWYVWIALPGFGRPGPWSTKTKNRRQAEQMEAWLRELPLTDPQLVRGIVEDRWTLPELWVAKLENRLAAMKRGLADPALASTVEKFKPHASDDRVKAGLDQLLEYAPQGARLSWLSDRKAVRDMVAKALETRKPNSVRRSLWRAVMELLAWEVGEDERARMLRGVKAPGGKDERTVKVSPAELRALLDGCDEEVRPLVEAAILTAIDLGPLLRATPRALDEQEGTLDVADYKTESRPRLLRLSPRALAIFRRQAIGKAPDEPLFGFRTRWQVRKRFEAARATAKLPALRFKDLRHLLPTALAAMKVDRREIQAVMGHAPGSSQTDRYITPAGDPALLEQAAERLLGRRLKVEG